MRAQARAAKSECETPSRLEAKRTICLRTVSPSLFTAPLVKTPFCPPKSSAPPFADFSVNLCTLTLPRALFEQNMDVFGDHALCCKKSGDRITRHNRLRNLVFKLADIGLLAPEMEKLG